MTVHFSKFMLNTYGSTPYFRAHIPVDYPLGKVLLKSHAFRRLPPNIRKLSGLAKEWSESQYPCPVICLGIEYYYDRDGNELDPDTQRKLTDKEIDAQWRPNPYLDNFVVRDIPIPDGGFTDPDMWEEPEKEEEPEEPPYHPTDAQLRNDIASRGRAAVAATYGIPIDQLPDYAPGDFGNSTDETNLQEAAPGAPAAPAGYTGVITDKIGRKYHYVNGVRVKSHEHEAHVKAGHASDEYQHHSEIPTGSHADRVASWRPQNKQKAVAPVLSTEDKIKLLNLAGAAIADDDFVAMVASEGGMAHHEAREYLRGMHVAEVAKDYLRLKPALDKYKAKRGAEEIAQKKKATEEQAVRDAPPPLSDNETAKKIAGGKVQSKEKLTGSANKVEFIALEDGTKAVWKPASGEDPDLRREVKGGYWKREVAAYEVAKILGLDDLVPVTVARKDADGLGSAQHFVEEARIAGKCHEYEKYDGDVDLARAAVFDLLLANSDRHNGNWMLSGLMEGEKPQLSLIDNGLSFPNEHIWSGHGAQYLVGKAGSKKLPMPPEVAEWGKHADKIAAALKHVGLSEQETKLTIERLHWLADAAAEKMDMSKVPYHMDSKASESTREAAQKRAEFIASEKTEPKK